MTLLRFCRIHVAETLIKL